MEERHEPGTMVGGVFLREEVGTEMERQTGISIEFIHLTCSQLGDCQ